MREHSTLSYRLVCIVFLLFSKSAISDDRENTVCGWFKERFHFLIWSSLAPAPDDSRVSQNPLIESVTFMTSDERALKGYIYHSHDEHGIATEPKGYILIALGNAMIADQMIVNLKSFSQRGYDVYIYDYRGYGLSEGKRRIKAFIEDYKEIIDELNSKYQRHLLYGISLGGAVLSNVIGTGAAYDRAVIDSSPSRFSPFGCPRTIDPVENLPDNAENILIITGAIDTVLPPDMTSELREVAHSRGATVFDGHDYSHPFMDRDRVIHRNRMDRVIEFLDATTE
ncbi:MAG: alpha/beta hydrolase [Candidatus Thiodiazotropha sp. (ex Monitilora ramsayi)]|nr:alpha/beta hydrolase [Candidatus Thiodiazotropha sp. (ex Monitilora ramsayi)]